MPGDIRKPAVRKGRLPEDQREGLVRTTTLPFLRMGRRSRAGHYVKMVHNGINTATCSAVDLRRPTTF